MTPSDYEYLCKLLKERSGLDLYADKQYLVKPAPAPVVKQTALLLRRAGQAETASHMNEWLTSPGLQPPKALKDMLSNQNK